MRSYFIMNTISRKNHTFAIAPTFNCIHEDVPGRTSGSDVTINSPRDSNGISRATSIPKPESGFQSIGHGEKFPNTVVLTRNAVLQPVIILYYPQCLFLQGIMTGATFEITIASSSPTHGSGSEFYSANTIVPSWKSSDGSTEYAEGGLQTDEHISVIDVAGDVDPSVFNPEKDNVSILHIANDENSGSGNGDRPDSRQGHLTEEARTSQKSFLVEIGDNENGSGSDGGFGSPNTQEESHFVFGGTAQWKSRLYKQTYRRRSSSDK